MGPNWKSLEETLGKKHCAAFCIYESAKEPASCSSQPSGLRRGDRSRPQFGLIPKLLELPV